jgi:D-alanyl-D-alanine carboxypeptidase/D-alanyl-D-alanine-endopeptidase (penicillin-binding protein 4)
LPYRFTFALALSALALQPPPPIAAAEPQASVESPLQSALAEQVSRAYRESREMGVHVVDVGSGATVFEHNADVQRIVASNNKLFTTAAALATLGPGYLYETRFEMRGSVAGGVLKGDLGVVGAGDPQISGRNYDGDALGPLRPWARALRERGIRRVEGDLYLADGLFEALRIHPNWPRDQLTEWYEAPIAALSFNDNCVLVRVTPGRSGQRPRVELVPPLPLFRVDNSATSIKRRRAHLRITRMESLISVSGSMHAGGGSYETWVTVADPVLFFGSALELALNDEGIRLAGHLHPVRELPGAIWERVATHRSDLLTAVDVTNKRSQNFYAESLAKMLGAGSCSEGSWRQGVRAIGEFLDSIGVRRGSVQMVDGSGMSRENQATPRAFTTLLRHMFGEPQGAEFAQSLPYGGEPMGSWRRRFAAAPYRGNVFAKTGTLRGVSALSGYAKAVSGRVYAFSILMNEARGDAHAAQDRIVMALVDNG